MRWVFSCALFFGACSSDQQPAPLDLAPAADLALPACNDPNPPAGGVCPAQVHGQVVDESGAAVAALTVSVCADQCFFGTTQPDGKFTVVPDQHIVLGNYALELHGRPGHVTYYTPLAAANGLVIDFSAPLRLPLLPASGPEIVADGTAQTVTSGDLTVTIPAATQIFFDVEDFGTANGHQLRVLAVDDPTKLPFVTQKPDVLYGCSPFEVSFSQKAALSFVNRASLPAGAAVEIQSMRGLVNGAPPAGRFQHAANAHVSADGKTITTDAGEGVTELTWLALTKQ
jgi:hypothetical protein